MKIAYLILAHRDIAMVREQIECLSTPDSVFFIHFDKKFNIEDSQFLSELHNVIILKRRFQVHWGGFNIVRATLELLNEAFRHSLKLDYFILLSGQCFPIKKPVEIEKYFEINRNSVMDISVFPLKDKLNGGMDKLKCWYPFDNLFFLKDNYKKLLFRYTTAVSKFLRVSRKLDKSWMYCFGSQWWSLNRECVEYVLTFNKANPYFFNFFKYAWAPDELYFQTILYNSPLRNTITNEPFRYLEWSVEGPPKVLTESDYDRLLQSTYFFARKLDSTISMTLINKLKSSFNRNIF